MTLRELMNEIITHELNPDAELIFITIDSQREKFTEGILEIDDNYIEIG